MSELFDEVDEDVRRDQLKKLWDQYSIFIIAGAILIIALVGGWRGYQYLEAKKAAEAGAAFDAASELSEQNKHAEAEAAFTKLAATAPYGYRMLSRLRAAAEVATRDPQAAAKLYDDIAADRSVGAPEQDLARVRRPIAAGNIKLSQHAVRPEGCPGRRRRPIAIPRANCLRCRPGAPVIRRQHGMAGSDRQ